MSSPEESEEESIGSDPKTPTALKVTTSKLSSKKFPSLMLPAAFPALIPEGKASTMSWDDQMSTEESKNLVFGLELELLNIIHRSAKLALLLGRECDVTSQCDSVTHNVTHDTDLWNGDHHVMSLSGYDMHLETNTKDACYLFNASCMLYSKVSSQGSPY